MSTLNKRYCSHCGTPNPRNAQNCEKCKKPLNSALKTILQDDEEEAVVVKKRPALKTRIVREDEESFAGDIAQPSLKDVIIEKPQKLTVASLKNGIAIPSFGQSDSLPADIEVTSRSYFHKENLD